MSEGEDEGWFRDFPHLKMYGTTCRRMQFVNRELRYSHRYMYVERKRETAEFLHGLPRTKFTFAIGHFNLNFSTNCHSRNVGKKLFYS